MGAYDPPPPYRLNTACLKYMFDKNYYAQSSFYLFLICLVFMHVNLSLELYMGGTFHEHFQVLNCGIKELFVNFMFFKCAGVMQKHIVLAKCLYRLVVYQ